MKNWSAYQEAIYSHVEGANGSLMVTARAGSGKTTTLIEVAHRATIRGRMAIVAFAQRSKQRVIDAEPPKHFDVSTLHSMGLALLRQHNPRLRVDNEGAKLLELTTLEFPGLSDRPLRGMLGSLVKIAKTRRLSGAVELMELVLNHELAAGVLGNVAEAKRMAQAVSNVLFESRERDDLIDFDDMIWMPTELGLSADRYKWLLVDEVQDLTRAQVALAASVCNDGRLVGFGDPAQAIYFFAGVDAGATDDLKDATRAAELPLSISYRCPVAVVNEARRLVPDIEAAPGAPRGIVNNDANVKDAKPGDLVLSRANAPLLKLCLRFLKGDVPAYIAGKQHGEALLAMLRRAQASTVDEFLEWIEARTEADLQWLSSEGKDTGTVEDRMACFRALADGARSMADMQHRIERLFTERKGAAIVLSTIHQMKGEEFDRVFVLTKSFRKPLKYHQEAGESEERNLWYVAITRAKRELHYVHEDLYPKEASA